MVDTAPTTLHVVPKNEVFHTPSFSGVMGNVASWETTVFAQEPYHHSIARTQVYDSHITLQNAFNIQL